MQGGASFRLKNIWTLPIDDLFRANIDKITKIYNKYLNGMKKHINLEDCKEICAPLIISNYAITEAYAFSKVSIVDEMNNKDKYEKMLMCEFLDFICRVADFKFKSDKNT